MNLEKKSIVPSNQMAEKEYRNLTSRISSSDIRLFLKSRRKFYNQCVLGQKEDSDDESVSTILGNIADCILTGKDGDIDNRFVTSSVAIPGGQMGELCEELFKRAKKGMRIQDDGSYIQTEAFEVIFTDAVNRVKYDRNLKEIKFKGKSIEKILELFTTADKDGAIGELYYKEKLAYVGKCVVDINMLASGEKIAQDMKDSPYTSRVVNMKSSEGIDVFNQLIILFSYRGIAMRSMLDKVEVNHNEQYIQPYDIKTTYDNEGFDKRYLKELYIQAATYDQALEQWAIEHDLQSYQIRPLKYPVADTQNENIPLMYELTTEDIRRAYSGFRLKGSGKWYPGLDETLDAIKWHVETGNWNVSKYAYDRRGRLEMELEYV